MKKPSHGLTQSRLKEVFHYDPVSGAFTRLVATAYTVKVGEIAGSPKEGYLCICLDGHPYLAHRLAWLYMTGEWPKDQIDHIDLNRTNNAWANLREATHSQNNANKAANKNNRLGVKGVYMNGGRYQATISVRGKNRYLGQFATLEEASAAYADAARETYGEFARLA